RRLRLGQWTSSETKWIKTEYWTSLTGNITRKDYESDLTWLGCDLSAASDLTSLTDLYYDGEFIIPFWTLWIPEKAAAEYEKKFNVPYARWAQEGVNNSCDGHTIDCTSAEVRIVKFAETYSVKMLA